MTAVVCFHRIPNGNIIINGLYSHTAYRSFLTPLERRYGKLELVGIALYEIGLSDWYMKLDLAAYKVYSTKGGRKTHTAQFYPTPEVMSYIASRSIDIPVSDKKDYPSGVVYFAESEKGIKIGFSTKFDDRQKALRYQYPDIKFIGFMLGTMQTEDELHKRFRQFMITDAKSGCPNVDWFYPTDDIKDYIRNNAKTRP